MDSVFLYAYAVAGVIWVLRFGVYIAAGFASFSSTPPATAPISPIKI